MAINLWAQFEETSFNPLPIGWGNVVPNLPRNDYIISFRAKSETSKTLQIIKGGSVINVNLTPDFKEFTYNFLFTSINFHLYYDGVAGASDIIIENIKVIEKPIVNRYKYNLWEANGGAKSYNPLPASVVINNVLQANTEHFVSLRAKSTKLGTLRITDNTGDGVDSNTYHPLTSEFQTITKTFKSTTNQSFYLIDSNASGDIVVEDITVVEKPFGKATINGIDGFQSGKWISVNGGTVEVLDDETTKITATGTYNNYRYTMEVMPNTEYVFSSEHNGQSLISGNITGTDAFAGVWSSTQTKTFNSGNRSTVYLFFSSGTLGAGTYTFKKPMLNLGTIPAPYEKKRGERMTFPVPAGKNLFDEMLLPGSYIDGAAGVMFSGGINTASQNYVPVTPGMTYTLSNNKNEILRRVATYDANKSSVNPSLVYDAPAPAATFTIPAGVAFIRFHYRILDTDLKAWLVEGTAALPYEPYRMQRNKKAIKETPKKNLLTDQILSMWNLDAGVTKTIQLDGSFLLESTTINYAIWATPVKLGIVREKEYTLSCKVRADNPQRATIENGGMVYFDVGSEWKTISKTAIGSGSYAIKPGDNTKTGKVYVKDIQLEEGKLSTFEPYKIELRKAIQVSQSKR